MQKTAKEHVEKFISEGGDWNWVLTIFAVVFATLLISYITQKIINKFEKKFTKKSDNVWDDAFIFAIRKPIHLIFWAFGITAISNIIYKTHKITMLESIDAVKSIALIVAVAWFVLRFIKQGEKNILKANDKIDHSTANAVTKLLKASVVITALIVALQTLGVSVSGILAFGGVGGVAVGFAAKDLLANFFGAITIYFDRPFVVGDWIRSPDRDIEGVVESIGWRLTQIRTFEKRPLYVPNSVFTTVAVENPTRMTHRRIKEIVGVRYDDMAKVKSITEDIKRMLEQHPDVDETHTILVTLDKFGASSVDIMVMCFSKITHWAVFAEKKQDIMLKISDIIDEHGAEIAYPTRVVYQKKQEESVI